MKQVDCICCGVSQQKFGELCSSCHYTTLSNKKLQLESDIENEAAIRFWARMLTYFFFIVITILFLILISLLVGKKDV